MEGVAQVSTEAIVVLVASLVFVIAVGGSFGALLWRRRRTDAAFDALFQDVPEACFPVRAAWLGGDPRPEALQERFNLAVQCLLQSPWSAETLTKHLTGLRIIVHAELKWVDEWDRLVAGLAYPDKKLIAIGSDFAALPHELGEVVYTAETGKEDWQLEDWDGCKALESAIREYGRSPMRDLMPEQRRWDKLESFVKEHQTLDCPSCEINGKHAVARFMKYVCTYDPFSVRVSFVCEHCGKMLLVDFTAGPLEALEEEEEEEA